MLTASSTFGTKAMGKQLNGGELCSRLAGLMLGFEGIFGEVDEGLAGERFLQEEGVLEEFFRGGVLLKIAGHIGDFDARQENVKALAELEAPHFGHDHVRQDEMDGFAHAAGGGESFESVLCGEHTVAGGAKEFRSEFPHFFFILDNENCFSWLSGFGGDERGVHGMVFERLFGAWKVKLEASALAGRGVQRDEAAALLDDAVNGGETEAGAFAGLLGGEEGFENTGLCGVVHAAACVGDADKNVMAGLRGRELARVALI